MFRYIAVGGGLVLLLLWAGPWITAAAKRTRAKQDELYDELEDAADQADVDDTQP